MRPHDYIVALLTLLVCPAAADSVLPGLVQESLPVPITLPDGRQVRLEAMVVRPDRPEHFPLVVLVHGTPRGVGATLRTAMALESPAELLGAAMAFARAGPPA